MSLSLRARMLTAGGLILAIPLLIICLVLWYQTGQSIDYSTRVTGQMAERQLDDAVERIHDIVTVQDTLQQRQLAIALAVAEERLELIGGIRLLPNTMLRWRARNQFTDAVQEHELPELAIGERPLGQVATFDGQAVPLVDMVTRTTGVTVTIFQDMGAGEGLLRVATSVRAGDGSRAIGTFIPDRKSDGTDNPVVATVRAGDTYRGRAFVVDRWYLTVYRPFAIDGTFAGVLYVGVPMESLNIARQAVLDTAIGDTGYAYVLDLAGNYVVSKGGTRDGENILDASAPDGSQPIRTIVERAATLDSGSIATTDYQWQNSGEGVEEKIVHFTTYPDWGWIIAAGCDRRQLYQARDVIAAIGGTTLSWSLGIGAGALLLGLLIWWRIASRLTKGLRSVISGLTGGSSQVASAAGQISASGQSLAAGASQQAASLEEVSASLSEFANRTDHNASHAGEADRAADGAGSSAQEGRQAMERLTQAIDRIEQSATETAVVIKTIDGIAFQTNLLALNAAVEAARAGDAGQGFAVVAEEVRNLAGRCAEAAKSTADLIAESQQNAGEGVAASSAVGAALASIVEQVERVRNLVGEVASASQEQADGVGQVTSAVGDLDQVTQTNAATAEESASAGEELAAQAAELEHLVVTLARMVDGQTQDADGPGTNGAKQSPAYRPSPPITASARRQHLSHSHN